MNSVRLALNKFLAVCLLLVLTPAGGLVLWIEHRRPLPLPVLVSSGDISEIVGGASGLTGASPTLPRLPAKVLS
jgi:hypothetical protein